MNGMANLPQFYQDIMRSHFANALNQQQSLNNNLMGHHSSMLNANQVANLSHLNNVQQQQQHQQSSMVAAVQAAQAQVHKQQQQQNHFVNQMQTQMAAAAVAAANMNQQIYRPQPSQPSNLNGNAFQYPQKSFFMPSNLEQIKSTINSFYYQQNNGNTGVATQRSTQAEALSKDNLLLYQQNLMQQHIENHSKRLNFPKQQQQQSEQGNRGRGRPKRQTQEGTKKLTPSPTLSNVSRTTSPISDKSRSRSPPKDMSKLLKKHNSKQQHHSSPNTSQASSSHKIDLSVNTSTRTSTPSKLVPELNESCNQLNQSDEKLKHEDDEFDDRSHTDVYSSIYGGDEEANVDIDIEDDDEVNYTDMLPDEEEEEEESILSAHETEEFENDTDELNATSSTSKHLPKPLARIKSKELPIATTSSQSRQVYDFTLQALEMSLYGYLRQSDPMFASHAISGLRIPPAGFRSNQYTEMSQQHTSNSSSTSNSSATNTSSAATQKGWLQNCIFLFFCRDQRVLFAC